MIIELLKEQPYSCPIFMEMMFPIFLSQVFGYSIACNQKHLNYSYLQAHFLDYLVDLLCRFTMNSDGSGFGSWLCHS